MSTLPDRKRPRLTQPVRSIATSIARLAGHGTWRILHPSTRGRFLEAPPPKLLPRLYYEAGDGWRAPLLKMPVLPGAPGEPVLLAHGLGMGADGLRYGAGATLAGALQAAGFAVYLWTHRADADAIPPHATARSQVSFDAILERDLPAAVERLLDDAEHPRLHFVGHGMGGQLGLCWAAGRPDGLSGLVALSAPLRFESRSALRRGERALALLPGRWRLPLRTLAKLAAPFVDDGGLGILGDGSSPGGRVRGGLAYGTQDLPVRLLQEVLEWHRRGALVSSDGGMDWSEALSDANGDLLVVYGGADELCPPHAAQVACETWGGRADWVEVPGLGHLDLLHAANAEALVFTPIVDWLVQRRKNTWLDASMGAAYTAG